MEGHYRLRVIGVDGRRVGRTVIEAIADTAAEDAADTGQTSTDLGAAKGAG
jgi:hypothetical protein